MRWNDNWPDAFASHYFTVTPISKTERRVKNEHRRAVEQPILGGGNSSVGGGNSSEGGGNSLVVKCPPPNWKVGRSIHSHWVNCRGAPWARAFTSATGKKHNSGFGLSSIAVTKINKKKKQLHVMKMYNQGIGDVDVCDRMLSSYRPRLRSRMWWYRTYLAAAWIFLLWRLFAFTAMPITLRQCISNFEDRSQGIW